MSRETQTVNVRGVGLFGLLGIAFIVLKLCGVINWSWWLVTMPLWFGLAVFLLFALVFVLVIAFDKYRS